MSIEAGELLELYLWKPAENADPNKVKKELADKYGLDVARIMQEKLEKNKLKYPVTKAKGSAKKYNEL